MRMKLHELTKGDKFKLIGGQDKTVYTFIAIDGLYAKVTWQGIHDEYIMIGNPMMEVEVESERA